MTSLLILQKRIGGVENDKPIIILSLLVGVLDVEWLSSDNPTIGLHLE